MVKSDVKFIVRVLPSTNRDWECVKVEKNRKTIHIRSFQTFSKHPERPLYWEFNTDGIITDSCQDVIYDKVTEGTLNRVFKGVDMVIFAYGQSGTGKTYTMMGLEDGYNYRGLAPRLLKDTLDMAKRFGPGMEFFIELNFVEFDNDKCYNLLASPPKIVDPTKLTGIPVKNLKDGLAALFNGEKRRKYENQMNHCAAGVVTISIKGVPVAGSSSSNTFSSIYLVDTPGTEQQYAGIKSDNCQNDANLTKFSLDKAKTWYNILARKAGQCQTNGRCPAIFKTSNLIHYLGRSFTNGIFRLIGHIRAEHDDVKNTLWTLKFGGKLARKQKGEMVYTFAPNYKRLTQLLEEEVKQLRDEIVVSELLRGEYTQLNMCQSEMEHMERLVKSYINGQLSEACLLSAAKPNVVLHALKKIYIEDLSDLKQAFKVKLKEAAETISKEITLATLREKDKKKSTVGGSSKGDRSTPTASASRPVTVKSSASSSSPEKEPPSKTESEHAPKKKGKKEDEKKKEEPKKVEQPVKVNEEAVAEGKRTRQEMWNEWSAKNPTNAEKLRILKEEVDVSSIQKDRMSQEVAEMQTRLTTALTELEEAKWQRMLEHGDYGLGGNAPKVEISAKEKQLQEEINQLKKGIYEKCAHMAKDHQDHMKKLNDYNATKAAAELDFQSYVKSAHSPAILFPPPEDIDVVPTNPIFSVFKDQGPLEASTSEIEFLNVQTKCYRPRKFEPRKKWH